MSTTLTGTKRRRTGTVSSPTYQISTSPTKGGIRAASPTTIRGRRRAPPPSPFSDLKTRLENLINELKTKNKECNDKSRQLADIIDLVNKKGFVDGRDLTAILASKARF